MGEQRILAVVGTRPNFMKIAPILAELRRRPEQFCATLAHTGQHYDDEMSRTFLRELGLGQPDHMLDVGSGSHGLQTGRALERLEAVIQADRPDLVLVPGDVNSTLAAALAAAKLGVPVAHVEAGLRSFDRSMPEEINRVVVDSIADLLLIHSPEARENLVREGVAAERIHDVGNTMIDSLVAMRPQIEATDVPGRLGLDRASYVVVTLHRPALVDGPLLAEAMDRLQQLARQLTVVFPAHPRTRTALETQGLVPDAATDVRLIEPLGYVEFLSLLSGAAAAVTDSGGIQEETTFLGIPCFTLRDNTERPITVELGTNTLLGLDPARIADVPRLIEAARLSPARVPPLWDGRAAERTVAVLAGAPRAVAA